MSKKLSFLVLPFLFYSCVTADPLYYIMGSTIVDETFKATTTDSQERDIDYSLLILRDAPDTPQKKYPLLFLMHGAGDSGGNYIQYWENQAVDQKVMILAPNRTQDLNYYEMNTKQLMALLDEVVESYPIDKDRIHLGGISSGAYIANLLLLSYPEKWESVIFVAKMPEVEWIQKADVSRFPPILYAHGSQDTAFSVDKIGEEISLLRKAGAEVSFLKDLEAGHEHIEDWNQTLFEWMNEPVHSFELSLGEDKEPTSNEEK